MKTDEHKKMISERTKAAMNTEIVRKHHSESQRKRFQREEERIKSSIRSKEIMSRTGMKDLISERTKEAMKRIPREELVSTKNMTNEEVIEYRKRVGRAISAVFTEETKNKIIAAINKHYKEDYFLQCKMITATRKNTLKRMSQIQAMCTDYLKAINCYRVIPEFPINV